MEPSRLLQRRIAKELEACRSRANGDLLDWVESGRGQKALEALLFFTPPHAFPKRWSHLRQGIERAFPIAGPEEQSRYLQFLVHLALALRSFLVHWNLRDLQRHGRAVLSEAEIERIAGEVVVQVARWSSEAPEVAEDLLHRWKQAHGARQKAEGIEEEEAVRELTAALVGASPCDYLESIAEGISRSNLHGIALMRAAGETVTELGNDHAAFLPYAMYLGASFVTSNPALVDLAWVADPDFWNPVVDRLIARTPGADDAMLARLMTLEIVWHNMRLLRPIFLLTGGKMGYVSLQVNPKKHDDAQSMVNDVLTIYEDLQDRLDNEVPNVVFKLPATLAGLQACRETVTRGIGVNITVNLGLFQELPFAEVIAQGRALVSYLTVFNGRLAFQIRDELLSRLDGGLSGLNVGTKEVREAAAWAGVAVVKRLHRLLVQKGYDLTRVRPLVASLRFYSGADYEGLPTPCPDITENLGVSVISVLPQVRRLFDGLRGVPLNGRQVERPVPQTILDLLVHSEIFKQAYWVGDKRWLEGEDKRFQPAYVLRLEDVDGTASWPPMQEVLDDFSHAYDGFVERIRGRKQLLALQEQVRNHKHLGGA